MKKYMLIAGLVASIILNILNIIWIKPVVSIGVYGTTIYSGTADAAWTGGYQEGKRDATVDAIKAINSEDVENFMLNAEQALNE